MIAWVHREREKPIGEQLCAQREEKPIFSANKMRKNVEADVYSSRREERKKSEHTAQNTRILPDSVLLNIQKRWMCLGNTAA